MFLAVMALAFSLFGQPDPPTGASKRTLVRLLLGIHEILHNKLEPGRFAHGSWYAKSAYFL